MCECFKSFLYLLESLLFTEKLHLGVSHSLLPVKNKDSVFFFFLFLIRFRLFSRWDLRRAAIFISHQRCFVFTKGPDLEKCIIRLMMDPTAYHKIQIESIEPFPSGHLILIFFFCVSPSFT